MTRLFLQLGSIGDIINILPVCKHCADRGDTIYVLSSTDFGPHILDAVSYVKPIYIDIDMKRIYEVAVAFAVGTAEQMPAYDQLIVTQVHGNPYAATLRQPNFTLAQWALIDPNLVPLYSSLPLMIDRRDSERERRLLDQHFHGNPAIAYNLTAKSVPFKHRDQFEPWLQSRFQSAGLISLDLRAERFVYTLAILERVKLLITVDTATLHLGYACKVPTVCLTNDNPWLRAQRRDHWLSQHPYGQIDYDLIEKQIRQVLQEKKI